MASERTKGKASVGRVIDIRDNFEGMGVEVYHDGDEVHFLVLGENDEADAQHLVDCWNAFEEGGAVADAISALVSAQECIRMVRALQYEEEADNYGGGGLETEPFDAAEEEVRAALAKLREVVG